MLAAGVHTDLYSLQNKIWILLQQAMKQIMAIKKDEGWYCWLVAGAIFISNTLASMSTYGTISVLVYIWIEKFDIPTEVATWAPSVMNISMFLIGNYGSINQVMAD